MLQHSWRGLAGFSPSAKSEGSPAFQGALKRGSGGAGGVASGGKGGRGQLARC